MRVLVSGATGLIGVALSDALRARGDIVVSLSRNPDRAEAPAVAWDPRGQELAPNALEDVDAVIHLAGESIAAGRWTPEQKDRIRLSRTQGTRLLAEAIAEAPKKPSVFVSASAIGFYGNRDDEALDETSASGTGFLAEVCIEWEAAAEPAREAGVRVVHPRIGIVLAKDGGALEKMLLPFRLGLGGRMGSGQQYMSWIALEDVVGLLLFALDNAELSGPMNVTAPSPATNAEFTRALGRALGRPTLLPLPRFAARLALGEMADELLFFGARVQPATALSAGYRFEHNDLETYLRTLV